MPSELGYGCAMDMGGDVTLHFTVGGPEPVNAFTRSSQAVIAQSMAADAATGAAPNVSASVASNELHMALEAKTEGVCHR